MKLKPTIVVDWDETITIKDTIDALSKIAYKKKPDFKPDFSYFTDSYLKDLADYQLCKPRNTLGQEYEYQKNSKSIELASINRIARSGLFLGLDHEDFKIHIPLKSGFIKFARKCNNEKIPIVILSVNWSSLIMRFVLKSHNIHITEYLVNELQFNCDNVTTGNWLPSPRIHTGDDKLIYFKKLEEKYKTPLVYIGDSSTDLFPLLKADLGIVIKDGSILSTLDRLKINASSSADQDARLYHASWERITELVSKKYLNAESPLK